MNNKQRYIEFCKKEPISIFMQPFWLDSVCEDGMRWDVILYEKGGEIRGSFVYVVKQKYGFTLITMPKLTQVLGPYIKYPKGQKYYKKLSWDKEVMNYFIDNLPQYDYFNMNFHYSYDNWLPFYWHRFEQTTRYTYRIDKTLSIEASSKNFETDIRRRRRKAEKVGVKIIESENIENFFELNKMTFARQNKKIPYTLEFVKKLFIACQKNNACKILFAQDIDGNDIATNFLVYDKNSVYYLMGGIDPDKRDLGGMDVIQYESIKFALETGRDFDFEGSMIESIEKYFRSFGAIQKQYFNISKTNSKTLRFKTSLKDMIKAIIR